MFEHFEDGYLSRQELLDVVFGRSSLGDDLDGDVGLVPLGEGQLDGGVRPVAERAHDVVAVRHEHGLSTLVVHVIFNHLRRPLSLPRHPSLAALRAPHADRPHINSINHSFTFHFKQEPSCR